MLLHTKVVHILTMLGKLTRKNEQFILNFKLSQKKMEIAVLMGI